MKTKSLKTVFTAILANAFLLTPVLSFSSQSPASSNEVLAKNINNNNSKNWSYFYEKLPNTSSVPKDLSSWSEILENHYKQKQCASVSCISFDAVNISQNNEKIVLDFNVEIKDKESEIMLPLLSTLSVSAFVPEIKISNKNIYFIEKAGVFYLKNKVSTPTVANIELTYYLDKKQDFFIKGWPYLDKVAIINNKTEFNFVKNPNYWSFVQENKIKNPEIEPSKEVGTNEIKIYRKLTENLPYQMITRVEISSSENKKKFDLGTLIDPQFKINQIILNKASLSLTDNKRFEAIVGLGSSVIEIHSSSNNYIETLNIPSVQEGVVGAEIISIEKNFNFTGLSLVSNNSNNAINTIASIDPKISQTVSLKDKGQIYLKVPNAWNNIDSYLLLSDKYLIERITTKEAQEIAKIDKANVQRNTSIGFDNKIYDKFLFQYESPNINNEIFFNKNINSAKENGQNATVLEKENKPYLLIQGNQSNIEVTAIEKDSLFIKKLPTNITNIKEFNVIRWDLSMEPKNKIVFYKGAKYIQGAWQSHWSLYSFFGLIIITFAFYKLFGKTLSAIAFLSIAFNIENSLISFNMWPALLILMALLKAMHNEEKFSQSNILKLTKTFSFMIFISFFIYISYYTLIQTRYIINPSLIYNKSMNFTNASLSLPNMPEVRHMEKNEIASMPAPASMGMQSMDQVEQFASKMPREQVLMQSERAVVKSTNKTQISAPEPKYKAQSYFVSQPDKIVTLYVSPRWLTDIFIIINITFYWLTALVFLAVIIKYNLNELFVKKLKTNKIYEKMSYIV